MSFLWPFQVMPVAKCGAVACGKQVPPVSIGQEVALQKRTVSGFDRMAGMMKNGTTSRMRRKTI